MATTLPTLGIMSPSSTIVLERFEAGLELLYAQGFSLVIHPQTFSGAETGTQYAGSPEEKIKALYELWADPSVDMVMASCGGNRAVHLLPHLDTAHAKPLMGFSDTTALLCALYNAGKKSYFGPTVQTLARLSPESQQTTLDVLSGQTRHSFELTHGKILRDGSARAPVFAATLSVLTALCGTPYFPKLAGHILILEDIGEELSHLDRTLWQLSQCADFKALAGLVFGEFTDTRDTGRPFGGAGFEALIDAHIQHLSCPVITGAPIGHGRHLCPVRLGQYATLDTLSGHLILE